MRIYIAHASNSNYQKDLYEPILLSKLNQKHTFVLPYHSLDTIHEAKRALKECDLLVAEVSQPSTGVGIELGWAEEFGKRIACLHKKDTSISTAIALVTQQIISYETTEEFLLAIKHIIDS